ncbi:MAG: Dabb family protein [Chloroflexota bacterium]
MHAHNVYFSLQDQSQGAIQRLLDDCVTYLSIQHGITSFRCGVRDQTLDRDVNDLDFDVSLHIVFESRAAHDAYQIDEQHDIFVERNSDNWAGVRVFDTSVQSH